ncbi:TIP41-like family protein [Actinidia rufa]|uniref:TIP41-like family protein n=1 Tax=Actinidia rufa TaxID=165716 RepID=A0A7J0DTT6_9ERIC|nr:TIP41-like family protein [Actinidia rufa]
MEFVGDQNKLLKPPEPSSFPTDAVDYAYMIGRSSLATDQLSTLSTSNSILSVEHKLQTSHLPEMVFGDSSLVLKHVNSGTNIHFKIFDALTDWKEEALPPVKVPEAAKWKFRRNIAFMTHISFAYWQQTLLAVDTGL